MVHSGNVGAADDDGADDVEGANEGAADDDGASDVDGAAEDEGANDGVVDGHPTPKTALDSSDPKAPPPACTNTSLYTTSNEPIMKPTLIPSP